MDRRVPSGATWPARSTAFACLIAVLAVFTPLGASAAEAGKAPEWDSRVAELAAYVERTRGLAFKHAVRVRFLPDDEFTKKLTADHGELTKDRKRDLEHQALLLRAVGLIQLDAGKLLEGVNAARSANTLAIYSDDKETIFVRGEELGVATKVILVHELTHALQDQHFDLERIHDRSPSGYAVRALVEGDAIRIEHEYRSTLSQPDKEAYDAESDQKVEEARAAVPAEAPAVLQIMQVFPYSVGRTFVEALLATRERKGVDDAFRKPPQSSKQVLNPGAFLDGDKPARIRAPKLREGEKRVGKPDVFGAFALYLMLSARLDPAVALSAIASWDGDSSIQFTRSGTACVRVTFRGSTAESTAGIAAALEQWAALGPSGSATVVRAPDKATVTACDPGAAADDEKIRAAGNILGLREFILSDELGLGELFSLDRLTCIADRVAVGTNLVGGFWVDRATDEAKQLISDKVGEASFACA